MNSLIQDAHAHYVVIMMICIYVFSAAVAALPDPGAQKPIGQLLYQWLFAFAHTLLNNVEQAAKAKYPQINFGGQTPKADPPNGGKQI